MSLIKDQYIKSQKDNSYHIDEYLGIIETWGELKVPVWVYDHLIEPFDQNRDYNDISTPQRLLVRLNVALENKKESWNPAAYINDISAILALVTGRLMRPSEKFCLEVDGKLRVVGRADRAFKGHPNLTVPVQNDALQDEVNLLTRSLLNVRTKEDLRKHCTLMRTIRLYRDSLSLLPVDDDAAYFLLVVAGETLGKEFSTVKPVFEDLEGSGKIVELVKEYNLPNDFFDKLKSILLQLQHLKLQTKFVDVITSHLRKDFFENPEKEYIPRGSYDQQKDRVEVQDWLAKDPPWFMKPDQLQPCLKELYSVRSKFAHEGIEWPQYSKIGRSHDIITPIKIDKEGIPQKRPDGTFVKEKPTPSYFWFERVINNVIKEVIRRFGQRV